MCGVVEFTKPTYPSLTDNDSSGFIAARGCADTSSSTPDFFGECPVTEATGVTVVDSELAAYGGGKCCTCEGDNCNSGWGCAYGGAAPPPSLAPTAATSDADADDEGGSDVGMIIGIVIGVLVLVGGGVFFLKKKK